MAIKRLDWDSRFFEMEVGCTSLELLSNISNEVKMYDLLYLWELKVIEEESVFFPDRTCSLIDCKLVYSKSISVMPFPTSYEVKEYEASRVSLEQLYQLAYLSGKYSRYKLDTGFALGKFEEMYRLWVDRSVLGEIADYLYYIENKSVVCAFVTLKIVPQKGVIGLIATSEKAQGKGMGKALISKCEDTLRLKGIKRLDVATQARNKAACLFYEKCKMTVVERFFIYHSWNCIKLNNHE